MILGLRVPRPDLSLQIGTPNACTMAGCHEDETSQWAADRYIEWYGPGLLESGVAERETGARTEVRGDLAQRWSQCAWRWGTGAEAAAGTSQVSMQLVRSGADWKIASMTWQVDG